MDTKAPEQAKKPARRIGRSPGYPSLDLQDALEKAQALYKAEQRHPASFPTIMQHWGYSPKSGPGRMAFAAVKSFGLIEVVGAGGGDARSARISDSAARLLLDTRPDSSERKQLLVEAALRPAMHRKLWAQYGGSLPSDTNLAYELRVKDGFSEVGVKDFLSQFRKTLAFAEVDASSRISEASGADDDEDEVPIVSVGDLVQWRAQGVDQFVVPRRVVRILEDGFAFVEGSGTGVPVGELRKVEAQPAIGFTAPVPPRDEKRPGMNQNSLQLDEGTVILQYPSSLSAESYADLKDWLDLMARRVKRAAKSEEPPETEGT